MKVRAVTVFAAVDPADPEPAIRDAAALASSTRTALESRGLEVQTVRLALPPVDTLGVGTDGAARLHPLALTLDTLAPTHGFGFVSLGTIDTVALPDGAWEPLLEVTPTIIGATERIAITANVGSRPTAAAGTIAVRACLDAGHAIAAIARTGSDGFGNLRFAAIANCPAHIPFFPAACHDRDPSMAVGLALECADIVHDAFTSATDLEDARTRLVDGLAHAVNAVAEVARIAVAPFAPARFVGVDFSPAPFPAGGASIAGALESLGLPAFGGPGTTFVASFLTECLHEVARRTDMATHTAAGRSRPRAFSGLMMPVLEDHILATRAAEGHITIDRILLASAVCGLGLDTVPLPGDLDGATLGGVILDMATLAVRLDKPLTARLFPVPGKRAGDRVSWDFPYFAPSVALPLRGSPLGNVIGSASRHEMNLA